MGTSGIGLEYDLIPEGPMVRFTWHIPHNIVVKLTDHQIRNMVNWAVDEFIEICKNKYYYPMLDRMESFDSNVTECRFYRFYALDMEKLIPRNWEPL